eukprot:301237-Alexandrium_andersonii.AAC.2
MHLRTAHSDAVPLGALRLGPRGAVPTVRWLGNGQLQHCETVLWECDHCTARLAGPEGTPRRLVFARRRAHLLRRHPQHYDGKHWRRYARTGVPQPGQEVDWQCPCCAWAVWTPAPRKRQSFLALVRTHWREAHDVAAPSSDQLPPTPQAGVDRCLAERKRQRNATAARFARFALRIAAKARAGDIGGHSLRVVAAVEVSSCKLVQLWRCDVCRLQ